MMPSSRSTPAGDGAGLGGVVDDFFDDHGYCIECHGEGFLVNCCDDLCHGQGYCMHGDNITCQTCGGIDA